LSLRAPRYTQSFQKAITQQFKHAEPNTYELEKMRRPVIQTLIISQSLCTLVRV
jgi:hypothetical protein